MAGRVAGSRRPCPRHHSTRLLVVAADRAHDPAPLRRVPDRVVDQVADEQREVARGSADRRLRRARSISSSTRASLAASANRSASSRTIASKATTSSSSLPDSRRERSSRSETIRDKPNGLPLELARETRDGLRVVHGRAGSVSAVARIEATGVFSSWDAFATKSRRIASSRLASVTSRTTRRTESSSPTGVAPLAAIAAAVRSGPRRRPRDGPGRPAERCDRSSSGKSTSRVAGTEPRWVVIAAFAKVVRPSRPEQHDALLHRGQRRGHRRGAPRAWSRASVRAAAAVDVVLREGTARWRRVRHEPTTTPTANATTAAAMPAQTAPTRAESYGHVRAPRRGTLRRSSRVHPDGRVPFTPRG